jgi:polyisoprenoid-binding protein YceI
MTGSAEFDPSNLATSHVEATIDSTSVNTREAQRSPQRP